MSARSRIGLVAACLWGAAALANVAAVRADPSRLSSPVLATESDLTVDREELSFDCGDEDGHLRCRFQATYWVRNPTAASQGVVGAFYGAKALEVTVSSDGVDRGRALSPEDVAALDEALARGEDQHARHREQAPEASRFGFSLEVPAGGSAQLVARGLMEPGQTWEPSGYVTGAGKARHLYLGNDNRPLHYQVEYLLSPLWTWKGHPQIALSVRIRAPYQLADDAACPERAPGAQETTCNLDADSVAPVLSLRIERPPRALDLGGALVAIGGAFGNGLRLRGGFETASRGWLLESLVVETDASRLVQLVPAVEAASPVLLFIPSGGIGVGVPIRFAPERRAGVRLELSAMLYAVGAFFAVDLLPATRASPFATEVSLMLQVGG